MRYAILAGVHGYLEALRATARAKIVQAGLPRLPADRLAEGR